MESRTGIHPERIGIIDGHPSTRAGITDFIGRNQQWSIAWEAASAEEALTLVQRDKPRLLIMEILLPGKGGLEFIKDLMAFDNSLNILVHSLHSEEFYAERCLKAGALGYLPKSDSLESLGLAIERVLHDEIYLSPRITRRTLYSFAGTQHGYSESNHLHELTDRELEIMILMAHGHSCHESAGKLHISPRTVQVHRNNIRLKIGLENSLQLHAYAVRFYRDESV